MRAFAIGPGEPLHLVWTGCAASTIMSLRAGFYAQNGNANCATANQ